VRAGSGSRLLAALALLAVLVAPGIALCAPEREAEPPAPVAEPKDPGLTLEGLEERIQAKPQVLWLALAARFVPMGIGLVLLVAWTLRRERVRMGLELTSEPVAPTRPLDLFHAGALLVAAILILPVILLYGGRALAGSAPAAATDGAEALVVMALSVLPSAAVVLVIRRRMRQWDPPGAARATALGLATFCVASLLVVPLYLASGLLLGTDAPVQDEVARAVRDPQFAWMIAAYGVLVAPIAEETLFRGCLYPALRGALGGRPWIAMAVTSAMFSAVHGNLLAAVPLFGLAFVLNVVFERTDSLMACVVAHGTHNAVSMAPILLLAGA
jgi:membrane protease YdiL (CAAX protease family)